MWQDWAIRMAAAGRFCLQCDLAMTRENEEYLCGRTEAGKYASILIPRQTAG